MMTQGEKGEYARYLFLKNMGVEQRAAKHESAV
jgi:hypothetical protein